MLKPTAHAIRNIHLTIVGDLPDSPIPPKYLVIAFHTTSMGKSFEPTHLSSTVLDEGFTFPPPAMCSFVNSRS